MVPVAQLGAAQVTFLALPPFKFATFSAEQENLIESALNFGRSVDVDGEEEFKKVHRKRKPPKKLDENPSTSAEFSLLSYYKKEINEVLDMMISVLTSKYDNLKVSFKSFSNVLDPTITEYETENFTEALKVLAESYPLEVNDTKSLVVELEVFQNYFSEYVEQHCEVNQKTIRTAADIALKAEKEHNLFPYLSKVFRLFLTAPPSVCKSERSFSRLKLLKNYLRNRMKEKRLHYLMLLACEDDVTDGLDIQMIADKWKSMKTRRINI